MKCEDYAAGYCVGKSLLDGLTKVGIIKDDLEGDYSNCKIIGNIYENPELLGVK